MKEKIVDARVVEKTTAKLCNYMDFGVYTGFYQYSYLHFYGTKAKGLSAELDSFMAEVEKEYKEKFEKETAEKISKLEEKLLTTVDGWFKKPSKAIKKEIAKIREDKNRDYRFGWEWEKPSKYHLFLSKLNAVMIEDGEHHNLYEILP